MHVHLSVEGEWVVSEPLLSIEGDIELSVFWLILVKIPSWRLAVNSINQVCIPVLGEWIGNELSLLNVDLLTGSETAFSVRQSDQSLHIVISEINSQENLRLEVRWRLINVSASKNWILIIEHLNLVLGELVTPNQSVNVHAIPLNVTTGRVHDLRLRE